MGVEVVESDEPRISSWYHRMLGKVKESSPPIEEVIEKSVRAVEMKMLLYPQASIDAAQGDALAKLIVALSPEQNAVIQIGSMLLVKANGTLAARNLTQIELAYLESNPGLISNPHTVIHELQTAIVSDAG